MFEFHITTAAVHQCQYNKQRGLQPASHVHTAIIANTMGRVEDYSIHYIYKWYIDTGRGEDHTTYTIANAIVKT